MISPDEFTYPVSKNKYGYIGLQNGLKEADLPQAVKERIKTLFEVYVQWERGYVVGVHAWNDIDRFVGLFSKPGMSTLIPMLMAITAKEGWNPKDR